MTTTVAIAELEKLLPAGFHLELKDERRFIYVVLDDFDWSVWNAGLVLFRTQDHKLHLQRHGEDLLASDVAAKHIRFWWELPAGELADQLRKLIGVRAFTAKCNVSGEDQCLAVLNDDDKIVSRLQMINLNMAGQTASTLLTLQSLRGYEEETQLIGAALQNLPHVEVPTLTLQQQLLQAGIAVAKPLSKPDFRLRSDELVEAALIRMIHHLLAIARNQEPGLLADVDSEFVHQYRVNIRKARSLASLFKKVFSPERYRQLNDALKNLGKRTNDLRDLDVFLLDYRAYQEMLPDNLLPGLKQLAERLRRRRRTVFTRVKDELQAESYADEISALQHALNQEPDFAAGPSQVPLQQLVCKKIWKQYRNIVKDGALIDEHTADEAVHALRIKCKKLRYLLELFTELFSAAEIKQLIKQLKQLQDNLGRFNDFAVQREFLGQLARQRKIGDEQRATIHGLQAVLFDRQRQERNQVVANIGNFSDAEVLTMYRRIFASAIQESKQE